MTGKGKPLFRTVAAAADLEAEQQGERMTAPTRSKRAAVVGISGGHADNGPSHAPIHDYAEVEETIEPAAEIEVVVPRRGRGGRGRVQANPDLLNGPYPGGPEIHTLIPSFKSHIAAYIWNGEERPVGRAESRINSLKKFTYDNIGKGLAPLGIDVQADKDYLQMTGLFDLQHSFISPVDAPLLFAFVERWQPETNSFHMPWGEMTITLHDVQKILGAPVEGHVVSSSFDEDTERAHCVYLLSEMMDLGLDEVEEVWKKGGPTWRMIYDQLLMPGQSMTRRVQSYLTFLIGATLFPDKSCDRIKPWYMRILDEPELKNVGNYSWGSACLAYLYRELGICSRAMSKGLSGCTTLLQCWIYEYFPCLRPEKSVRHRELYPHCRRWQLSSKAGTLQHVRDILDNMSGEDVYWLPYGPGVHTSIPRTLYHGTIQYMWIVEPYMPDRVLRQFGFVQTIPRGLISSMEPCTRGPRGGQSYKVTYAAPGGMWNMLDDHSLRVRRLQKARHPCAVVDDYMKWYTPRTHPRIGKPNVGPAVAHRGLRPPDQPHYYQVVRALYPIVAHPGPDWLQQFKDIRTSLAEIMRPAARYIGIEHGEGNNDDDDDGSDDDVGGDDVQPMRRARRQD
ncbi:PREDICTED: serine/threonine-protein phosphatase 7 long form homolog [Erythranthe guttata]|uniref:serine/threonine-protein phosphatase 7 long form homolog n=1 Tax=Erythranthe guttata TaxID=4155 RepID=UPI00064DABE4|nr:PREDICTED: serine/threonine-protein phosphatase 7 long form homolog [Erythranthe guttata]|eukprot:XP_012836256.1 PREDICTED: serine/threonine-protein phosphatase 7 long form homolog [Erythranthe guttata]